MADNTLDWIVKNYLAAKIQRDHILNYNGANLAYNHAKDTAKKLGLNQEDQAQITPFPSPTSTSSVNVNERAGMAPAAKLLASGALGAALAAGSGTLGWYLAQPDDPVIEQPEAGGNVGYEIR